MIAPMVLSCLTVCVVAYVLGRVARDKMDPDHLAAVAKEIRRDHHTGDIKAWPQSRRSGSAVNGGQSGHQTSVATDIRDQNPDEGSKANWKIWVNAALTAGLLTCLVLEVADLMVLFIIGFIIALLVNFPRPSTQGEVIRQHAANAVPVVMLVLGAGVFTGILTETGMTTAMATTLIGGIPEELGGLIPVAAALIGIPLSFFMANDAYFFGIVPVLAESAAQYGIPAIDMARASVIGQMAHSIGPTSAPLWALLGIIGANLGDFQKFAWKPVLIGSLAYLGFALLTGAIALNL
ncbi:SLC13 family permease [Arthrobacter sp. SD76]|uniref:SLC13 family permease n=1 Tax=Arthrobacter sp. SD76 TaxID=3415007 RepID=UPI003C75C16C